MLIICSLNNQYYYIITKKKCKQIKKEKKLCFTNRYLHNAFQVNPLTSDNTVLCDRKI